VSGHIQRRGKTSFRIKVDLEANERTGERKTYYETVRGTKKDAEKRLAAVIANHDKGNHVDRSTVTVEDHVKARIAQWERIGDISAKTAERYRELLVNQIAPHIGVKRVQRLSVLDIETWHSTLLTGGRKDGKGGLSARTIGHAHRILSQALKDAAKFDLVTRNVASVQGAPKVDSDEMTILTDDRVRELLARLRGRAIYPIVVTLMFTGLRRGELLAARWRNIDIDNEKVIKVCEALEETREHGVRFKKPKTKSGIRDVTLPDIVVDALREHRKAQLEARMALGLGKLPDDALVFPALDGSPRSPRAFTADWADVAKSIGMGDITLQALRHTHASQLIDAGIDPVRISKRLGHANPSITLRVYAHLFRKRDDKTAAAINAALAGFGKT
jgi:integrase